MSDKLRRDGAPAAKGGPAQLAATFARALEHHRAGRVNEAFALYRRILDADPRHVDALHMTGEIALRAGHPDLAIEMIGKALEIHGDASILLVTYGAALGAQGKLVEAAAVYGRALALDPQCAAAHCNLGSTLRELGRPAEAVASCQRAIALQPNFPEALSNLGAALHALGEPAEAANAYRRALALKPDYVEALSNLGNALRDLGRLDEAIDAYRRALAAKPDYVKAHSNLLFCLNYAPDLPAEAIFAEYRRWNERHAKPLAPAEPRYALARDPERRLRVGYVSPDLRRHSARHFIEPLLERHDKSVVEVFAYAEACARTTSAPDSRAGPTIGCTRSA
jgi:tetratricopeptide (TPR) repeat protein